MSALDPVFHTSVVWHRRPTIRAAASGGCALRSRFPGRWIDGYDNTGVDFGDSLNCCKPNFRIEFLSGCTTLIAYIKKPRAASIPNFTDIFWQLFYKVAEIIYRCISVRTAAGD